MARRAEEVGVQKAGMDAATVFTLAVLAGAFIALGGVLATTALAGAGAAPWGAIRVLAGVAFSVGLVLVMVGGAGNFAGAAATALLVYLGGTHRLGDGLFGVAALGIAAGKLQLGFGQAVVLGILCNALVCLAVWLTLSARSTADRILAIVPPISAFVAAGFEHSIANMYFVPLGLFVSTLEPGFVATHGLERDAHTLTWIGFLVRNLLPVTIGNLIGGALLVGLVYWFVYLRPRGA
jgi:formate transporter